MLRTSLTQCRLRQSQAGNLFLGAYQIGTSRVLVAYICSTLSPTSSLTHESMSEHVPGGNSVCIHSVCVSSDHRRKGIGSALIKEYIARLERENTDGSWRYRRLLLITHDRLRPFYESVGFEWLGKSDVVHGSKPWYEMRRDLHSGTDSESSAPQIQQLPPGILDALQRSQNVVRSSRLLSDFRNGIADLINMNGGEGVLVNKFDLLCPKANCGSVILKSGIAKWVEQSSIQVNSCFPSFDINTNETYIAATCELPNPSRPSASPSATRNRSMVAGHWITHGVREYWFHTSCPTPHEFR